MKIISYQEDYLDDCLVLFQTLGYPTEKQALKKRLASILNLGTYRLDLAIVDHQAVGMIGYVTMPFFERDGSYLRILALAVHGDYQRRRVGNALLEHLKQVARKENCLALAVNSGLTEERKGAHQFYLANGFKPSTQGFGLYL
ncbi:GNAT family N-acetyltransferase [Streptococcus merionis]|uniref:GNAT family N-acetyltransferase n=1 Tax=Streptococcus merionis TaxID=400065 RepID=UPI0026EC0AC7|nr:GNAT family N-acetyltransferase [Streptococcus merionis]